MTRLLVIAHETAASEQLSAAVRRHCDPHVLVVAPALLSRIELWSSDDTRARREAQQRVGASLAGMAAVGIAAEGHVGDADPLLAIADALAAFPADAILISTGNRDVVRRAAERFHVPVDHLRVDAERAVA